MVWPLDSTQLDEPWASDPEAAEACDAARSEIRRALRSAPAGYQSTDAAILSDSETAAELLRMGVALAHLHLTQGRGGAGRKIVSDAAYARQQLKAIADGSAPLPLPREPSSASSAGRAVTVAGELESDLTATVDLWDQRVGGV